MNMFYCFSSNWHRKQTSSIFKSPKTEKERTNAILNKFILFEIVELLTRRDVIYDTKAKKKITLINT